MKLHELREEPEVEFIPDEDEEESAQLEEDLNQALKLIDEVLPHFTCYVHGHIKGERRSKLKQIGLDALLADLSIFIDQWTMPKEG